MTVTLQGFHPELAAIIQQNTLQRVFWDALMPRQLYRADVTAERWMANVGETTIFTRSGRKLPVTSPLIPGQDPIATSYGTEQWSVTASQFGDSQQTHMPTSRAALASKYALDIQKLGEGAGESLDLITRNRLFTAYLSGDTVSLALVNSGLFQVRVANLNGFLDTVVGGRVVPVSALAPIPVQLTTTNIANTVVAAVPDDIANPTGPGTITLGTALGANLNARSRVRALSRARILRCGGAGTVDALTTGSVLTVNDLIAAIQLMKSQNVPPHPDGQYHVHLHPAGFAQLYNDNAWQRTFQSIPDDVVWKKLIIGWQLGAFFWTNNQAPDPTNVGALRVTGTNARESDMIGAEVINETGVPIGRTVITGGGAIYEHFIPETDYTTEGGVNGRIGEFQTVNNGVQVLTDRIRLILRAPQDKLQQIYDSSWSWSGDFAIPTDLLTGNGSRYKRAVVIEHAAPLL